MQYFQPTNLHAKLNLMSENIMVHLFASKNSAKIFRRVKMNTFNNGTKFPPPMINSLIYNIRGIGKAPAEISSITSIVFDLCVGAIYFR